MLVLGRLLADISRNLPNKPIDVSTDGTKVNVACGSSRFALREMPVGRLPDAARLARDERHDRRRRLHPGGRPGLDRRRQGRHPADPHGRAHGDRRRQGHPARDRPLPPRHARADLVAGGHRREPRRAHPGPPALRHRPRARRLRLGRARPRSGGDGLIGFEAGQRRATTRLLDGEYPKVTSIFPTSVDTEAVIETAALEEAVKRVALVAERNTPVLLKFTDGQVAIEAGTGDDAQASEAVEATLNGPEIQIAFNPQFLLDGLHAVGTAWSRLSFTQPSRPAVLTGQAEADCDADATLPLRPHAGAFRQLTRPAPRVRAERVCRCRQA